MADTLSKLAKPAGATRPEDARRARRRLRARQDRRPRPEGPVRPHRAASSRTSRAVRRPSSAACPSAGSTTRSPASIAEVNVGDLEIFAAGANVDEAALVARGLVKGRFDRIKILGDGELTKAVTVSAHAFSKTAAQKIQKAGGKVVLVGSRAAQ